MVRKLIRERRREKGNRQGKITWSEKACWWECTKVGTVGR